MHYFDEWWSKSVYDIVFERCLNGNKDHAAAQADGLAVIKGDKFPDGTKTPRPSYVTWDLNPETVQRWIEDPESNQGWVLRMKKHTLAPDDQGSGLWFHGFRWGVVAERPKLTVRYLPLENVPPFTPTFAVRFDNVRVGANHVVRWTMPDPPDANGDKVHFELEYGKGGAPWRSIAADVADEARQYVWDTTRLPAEEGLRLRLRAVDEQERGEPVGGERRNLRHRPRKGPFPDRDRAAAGEAPPRGALSRPARRRGLGRAGPQRIRGTARWSSADSAKI